MRYHIMHGCTARELKEAACNLYLRKNNVLQCKKFRKLFCFDTAFWSVSNFHYFDVAHDLNKVMNRFFLNVRATLDKNKKRFCIEEKKN